MQDVLHLACLFWGTRDELTVEDSVLKGSRICIPCELHDRTICELHDCHQGVEKMSHIARSNIYWPSIDADYVRHCSICAKHKASQAVQPMLPGNGPDGPWQDIAANCFTHYLLQTHLANTHSYSKFIPRPQTVLLTAYKTFFPNMAILDASILKMDLHFPDNLSPISSHLLALTT